MTDQSRDLIQRLADALHKAEAALSDIGDAEREPNDDVQWCEDRASIALPITRVALNEARAYLAVPGESAVPDGREPTDEELANTYWKAWHEYHDRTNSVLHAAGLRAELSGEVSDE